jgi:hypothetical protein
VIPLPTELEFKPGNDRPTTTRNGEETMSSPDELKRILR